MQSKEKIILVDADPQCNSTIYCFRDELFTEIYYEKKGFTIYDVIKPVNQGIGYVKEVKKYYLEDFGFDFIAGDPQLALFEDTLASDWKDSLSGGERGIRTTLTFNDLIGRFKEYDYVIFDMGPSLGAINRAIFNMALTKLCRRAGLPHLTVHSLRHMYASILTEQGVPLIKVSALLGHSSLNTTFEYYCEVMDETEKIAVF